MVVRGWGGSLAWVRCVRCEWGVGEGVEGIRMVMRVSGAGTGASHLKVALPSGSGFRGRAVTTLIHRGFRLLGRFLLHVLSDAVGHASRIA